MTCKGRDVQHPSRASMLLFSFNSNICVINFFAIFLLPLISDDHFRAFQRGNAVLGSMELNLLTPVKVFLNQRLNF